MINYHSLTFRFSVSALAASLLLIVLLGSFNTRLVSKQYQALENGKLATMTDSVAPPLSLNISYGFTQAVNELAEQFFADKAIIYLSIGNSDERYFLKQRGLESYEALKEMGHFYIKRTLLDPVTSETLGTFEAFYSRENYDAMMSEYYNSLTVALSLFIALIIGVNIMLYRSILPLRKLALQMQAFDPQAPKTIPFTFTGQNEISFIAKAFNDMVDSIVDYMNKLETLHADLSKREAHLSEAQRMAHVGSWEYRPDDGDFEVSTEMCRIFGIDQKRSCCSGWESFLNLIVEADREYVISIYDNAIRNGSRFNIQYQCTRINGDIIHIHTQGKVRKKNDGTIRVTGVSMDITDQHRSQQLIEKLAYYDPLTGLPNRLLFKNRLTQSIATAKRNNKRVALLFIDLDHFKLINDTLGHVTGDELLKQVADTMLANIRESDTVSRLGGDEFIIFLQDFDHEKEVEAVARKLIGAMVKRWVLGKHTLHITFSMGIAYYPDHATSVDDLIKNADTAMYQAKEHGRNKYVTYHTQMGSRLSHQMHLEQEFRHSIETKEGLLLHYQPKIDLASGQINGVEALVRWEHPELGLLYPDSFIPMAESTGLIIELGNWVIEESIRQLKAWHEKGIDNLKIAINLSARQFQHEHLCQTCQSFIAAYDIDPAMLEFEITETISMANITENLLIMQSLKHLGVRLAIDDFGTGYSSLSYLKQFPVDTLKIDKSFVIDMLEDRDDRTIVQTIISMASALGLSTVAEGVEKEGHAISLKAMGCIDAQGYYYSRAVNATEIESILKNNRKNENFA